MGVSEPGSCLGHSGLSGAVLLSRGHWVVLVCARSTCGLGNKSPRCPLAAGYDKQNRANLTSDSTGMKRSVLRACWLPKAFRGPPELCLAATSSVVQAGSVMPAA